MRIKVSIKNSREHRNINVQSIELRNVCPGALPIIYFKCHRKYEEILDNEHLIFHNTKEKELFRSENVRLDFRHYEGDFRENKVKFSAKLLKIEDLGYVSQHFMEKIVRQSCNRLKPRSRPEPQPGPRPRPSPRPRVEPRRLKEALEINRSE